MRTRRRRLPARSGSPQTGGASLNPGWVAHLLSAEELEHAARFGPAAVRRHRLARPRWPRKPGRVAVFPGKPAEQGALGSQSEADSAPLSWRAGSGETSVHARVCLRTSESPGGCSSVAVRVSADAGSPEERRDPAVATVVAFWLEQESPHAALSDALIAGRGDARVGKSRAGADSAFGSRTAPDAEPQLGCHQESGADTSDKAWTKA